MQKHTKNSLGTSSSDDNLSAHRCNPNFDTRITIFSKFAGQNLIQFSEENSVGNELQRKTRKS
jgi:hypothetical protein